MNKDQSHYCSNCKICKELTVSHFKRCDIVPYKEALELKELGFNEKCFGYYHCKSGVFRPRSSWCDNKALKASWPGNLNWDRLIDERCSAPTYYQSFAWFRQQYDWPIECWIQPFLSKNPRQCEAFYWRRGETVSVGVFETHREAELACLRKLIEISKPQSI